MWSFPLFPESASSLAGRLDALYFTLLAITAFFTVLICFLVIFFGVRYRRGARVDRENALTHDTRLELLWIFIPLVIVIGLFVWSTILYFEMYNPPVDSTDIYVVGKQWMWKLQHPEGNREINELHVPLGRPVRLTMTSQDVIHSFYIPAFRTKQDVLPGRYTSLWFEPTKVGRYHLFCAEYCGTNHSTMIGSVIVMEPSDYERWLVEGNVETSMARRGAELFAQYGCGGCHRPGATIRAPLLEGIYGKPRPLEDGRLVVADEAYVRDSILLPNSQIVAGFEPIMPSFEGQIDEDDLLQIIEYIKFLGTGERTDR